MAVSRDPLPDDPVALKALLAAREVLISHLIEEIMRLKRWRFGRSAEKIDERICPQLPFQDLPEPGKRYAQPHDRCGPSRTE
jgi:hypothetical protein